MWGAVRYGRLWVSPGCDATVAWLETLPAPVRVVYEAGPTGYRLARACAEAGISCVVAAPSRIRPPADRVKTDRRDAERLARLLRLGEITPVLGARGPRRRPRVIWSAPVRMAAAI